VEESTRGVIHRRHLLTFIGGGALTLAGCGGSGENGSSVPVVTGPNTGTPAPTPPVEVLPPARSSNILVLGMSVFKGADLVPENYPAREAFFVDNAPVQYFRGALLATAGYTPALVGYDMQAVGGAFDHEVEAQYTASRQSPKNLVFLGLGMNSGSPYGVYGTGPNAGYTKEVLRSQLRRIKADGARAIVCNTVHPWPAKITAADISTSLSQGLSWPPERRTLFAYNVFHFDAAAGTLSLPGTYADGVAIFDHPSGGSRIKAGSQLFITGEGQHVGRTLIVTERVDGNTVRVRGIVATENVPAGVRHINPPLEEIMETPPSRQLQVKDWTGGGVSVEGLASFALWNAMLLDLCREEDVTLLDFEYRGFKWVERRGWPSVYTAEYMGKTISNVNHPVYAAQRVIYGELMASLASSYARGTLAAGFQVLRGPAIA
jgi:hypothetical protein